MFKKNYLLGLLFACLSFTLVGQLVPTPANKITASSIPLFRVPLEKSAGQSIAKELNSYGVLEVDAEAYAQQYAAAPEEWALEVPATAASQETLHLRLRRNNFLSPDFQLRLASSGNTVSGADLGHHYVGEVIGEPGSKAALSLLDNELTASITRPTGERLAIGRIQTEQKSARVNTYAIFPDRQLLERQHLDCATVDPGVGYSPKELTAPNLEKSTKGCVDIYFEIDYDIFFDKGNAERAAAHLAANFNEVAVLYATIGVAVKISEVLVWDKPSPYFSNASGIMLSQFQKTRKQFNGDLAQLISYQASGGIAVLDGLCHPLNAARMSFSSIASNFKEVPIYSWSTMVIAHELGHLMGSQHTHACAWNGNGTAIDGCAGFTEGFCGTPGVPEKGGTIMSYCHISRVGIDFNQGFGAQPGAVIANRVAAAQQCVQASCGTGEGNDKDDKQDPPEEEANCTAEEVYLRLALDNFGMETTWRILAEADAQVLAVGGPYPKKQAGRIVLDTMCLPAGCYIFEILDSHGDGICCDYGQGRFQITDAIGTLLGSGGQFARKEVIDFCLVARPAGGGEEPDEGGGDAGCEVISLTAKNVKPFGTNQDEGYLNFSNNGRQISIGDNAWKGVKMKYAVTKKTHLSFWFRSTRQGEVHGIGLDNNQVISPSLTFKLYGTQTWGIEEYNDYPGNGKWKYYSIPVGTHYTGNAEYLFFLADDDVGAKVGHSEFRDVQITEGAPCTPAQTLPAGVEMPATSLMVFPNPATQRINLRLPATGSYRIVDATGRMVMEGDAAAKSFELKIGELATGTYLLHFEGDTLNAVERFTVVK